MAKINNVKKLFLKILNYLYLQSMEVILGISISINAHKKVEPIESVSICNDDYDSIENGTITEFNYSSLEYRTMLDKVLEKEKNVIDRETETLKILFTNPLFLSGILSKDRFKIISTIETFYKEGLLTTRLLEALLSVGIVSLTEEEKKYLISLGAKNDYLKLTNENYLSLH